MITVPVVSSTFLLAVVVDAIFDVAMVTLNEMLNWVHD